MGFLHWKDIKTAQTKQKCYENNLTKRVLARISAVQGELKTCHMLLLWAIKRWKTGKKIGDIATLKNIFNQFMRRPMLPSSSRWQCQLHEARGMQLLCWCYDADFVSLYCQVTLNKKKPRQGRARGTSPLLRSKYYFLKIFHLGLLHMYKVLC